MTLEIKTSTYEFGRDTFSTQHLPSDLCVKALLIFPLSLRELPTSIPTFPFDFSGFSPRMGIEMGESLNNSYRTSDNLMSTHE